MHNPGRSVSRLETLMTILQGDVCSRNTQNGRKPCVLTCFPWCVGNTRSVNAFKKSLNKTFSAWDCILELKDFKHISFIHTVFQRGCSDISVLFVKLVPAKARKRTRHHTKTGLYYSGNNHGDKHFIFCCTLARSKVQLALYSLCFYSRYLPGMRSTFGVNHYYVKSAASYWNQWEGCSFSQVLLMD